MTAGRRLTMVRAWRLGVAYCALAIFISALAGLFFSLLENRMREAEYAQLAAALQFKAGEIESWLAERRQDAESALALPEVQQEAAAFLSQRDQAGGERLRRHLEASRAFRHARGMELLDHRGRPALGVGRPVHIAAPPPAGGEPLRAQLMAPHDAGQGGVDHFDFVVPLPGGSPPPGYLRIAIDPEQELHPLLRKWPLSTTSGQTLLVRHGQDGLLPTNAPRHHPGGAQEERPLLSALAMRPDGASFEARDQRDVPVMGVMRAVPGTSWTLIASEDQEEVLRPLHRLRAMSFAAILTGLLFGGFMWHQMWRRQSLDAQQALETQLSEIAAAVPGSIFSFRSGADGHVSLPYASPPMKALTGLNPEELAQDASPLFAMIHPDDIDRVHGSIAESARRMNLWREEFRFLHPERGTIWVEGSSTPQRDGDGAMIWHGYVQDISTRRNSEVALREAEERYRTLLDNIPGAAFRSQIGPPAHIVFLSDGAEAITGYPTAELLRPGGVHWGRDVLVAEDKPQIREAVQASIASGKPYEVEYRIRHADGGIRWLHEKGRAIHGGEGEPAWVDGVIIDISARVEAESALQASRGRWRQLAEAMPQLVWTSEPDGSCDYVNRRWCEYTGRPADERLASAWLEVVHPEDLGRLAAAWARSIALNQPLDSECRLLGQDGEYRWFKTRALPVRDHAGRLVKWYGSHTDIQDLKQFEAALHRALVRQEGLHELDRAVLEASSPEEVASKGLVHLAALLGFEYGTARVFDFEAGTASLIASLDEGIPSADRQHTLSLAEFGQDDLDTMRRGLASAAADMSAMDDLPSSLAAVRDLGLRAYVRLPLMAEGRLIGSLNLCSRQAGLFGSGEVEVARPVADVLAIALLQALLRQHLAQQAASLEIRVAERTSELARMKERAEAASRAKSQFLANMAHELRTPLNSLLVLSQLLADNTQANLTPEQIGFARVIHDAGNDLLCIVNDILDLSKIEAGRAVVRPEDLPLQEICAHVDRIFRPQAANKGLGLQVEADPDAPAGLVTDPNHLHPILRNLMGNAIKFTVAGSVRLRVYRAGGGWNPEHPVLSAAPAVLAFEVTDTGIGIAADKFAVIFEAFEQVDSSTTKRFGGTGLGLHIARSNAALLGGEIRVESTPGEGSVFTLFLPQRYVGPANLRPESGRPGSAAATGSLLGGRKVLVAEPELRSRISITAVLRQHGIRPLTAGGGEEALEVLATTAGIDALLMDTGLPDMNGLELLHCIRERGHDQLPVIALGRGRLVDDPGRYLAAGCDACLQKPVHAQELIEALAACMKAGRPSAALVTHI